MPSWKPKVPPRTGTSSKRSTLTRSRSTNSRCEPWLQTDGIRSRPYEPSSTAERLVRRRSGEDEDRVEREHDVRKARGRDAAAPADVLHLRIAARCGTTTDLDDCPG